MGIRRFAGAAAALILLWSYTTSAQVNVWTYHNDNARTGQNTQETTLTPANVNSSQFGKLFTIAVDGVVYAQPLYVSNLAIGGGTHNVVFIATQHDSVYAMDADTGTVYWQKSLIPTGGSSVNSSTDLNCGDITVEVGITGTPVIDLGTDTLYVIAKVKLNGAISQHLHALDLGSGAEKFGGPNTIQASVAGTANDGNGGTVTFNPRLQNQRAALVLENGHVVIGWTSHCDIAPWHGWIMSYNASTLGLEGVYNSSANGYGNGIWMSGGGLAADTAGNIFFATGNGSWNTTDQGDSIVKLGPPSGSTLPVLDYFTPYNQGSLESTDTDMSAGGVILLPSLANGKQLLATMGKAGTIYLLDRNNLGGYCKIQTPTCGSSNPQIIEEVVGAFTGLWGTPAFWNGNLYWGGGNDNTGEAEAMKHYSFNAGSSGKISTAPVSKTARTFNFSGPVPSISSNGNANAILWGIDDGGARSTCVNGNNCQILYAYDATNLATMLYNSNQAPNNRDVPGTAIKFVTPTIANGKVYLGSRNAVSAYGLLNNVPPTSAAPLITPASGTYTSTQTVVISDTTPNAIIHYTVDGSTPTPSSPTYSGALSIANSSTVNALATASGYGTSAVSNAAYTITVAGSSGGTVTPVNLGGTYNIYAIDQNGAAATQGGMDNYGDAYSGTLLGASVTWSGVTFNIGAGGSPTGVSASTIPLPSGSYTTLNLLATGVHGAQVGQTFLVTYTDGTTTTLTQSLSDWFSPQNFKGESKAATMPYRLSTAGVQQAGPYYLYGYAFAINGAKTVKSVTLPANRNVVVVSATLSGNGTGASNPTPPTTPVTGTAAVPLSTIANVSGIFDDGVPVTNGGVDTSGFAYSKSLLGGSLTWSGTTFSLGTADTADAASAVTIPLPAGKFTTLQLLATGSKGNQANQVFTVTYTDGTATTVTQSLSDWYTPQKYPGESIASTMPYRLGPSGAPDNRPFNLYGYSFAINSAKTVLSITLPQNRHVIVFSAVLSSSTQTTTPTSPATTASSVSLIGAANVYAVFKDGSAVVNGGLDGSGDALSEQLVGTSITYAGVNYTLLGAGIADAMSKGTLTLPSGGYSALNLLATSVKGGQLNQSFVVAYTDGTTATLTRSLSDWFTPQSFAGESTVLTMSYRLSPSGAMDTRQFNVYGYTLALDKTKSVKSVTLPNNRDIVLLAATLTP